jgi:hypothetical protein
MCELLTTTGTMADTVSTLLHNDTAVVVLVAGVGCV